jgi:hypothetical protein
MTDPMTDPAPAPQAKQAEQGGSTLNHFLGNLSGFFCKTVLVGMFVTNLMTSCKMAYNPRAGKNPEKIQKTQKEKSRKIASYPR